MNRQDRADVRLLYLTAEAWPTFRADVAVLFGKYLPRQGVMADLLTEQVSGQAVAERPWLGGHGRFFQVPQQRSLFYIAKLWNSFRALIKADGRDYDAIQVRDMSVTALLGLIAARMKGIRFFYWLSYPQSEGQVDRAKARGIRAGMRFFFPLLQGMLGKWLLYKIVLPRADHIFVQSSYMQLAMAQRGIAMERMTPVPMGVDGEQACPAAIVPADDGRLAGKRVLAYLGTLDRVRNIEILFQMLATVRICIPDALLVLVGDTEDAQHRAWLEQQAAEAGVADHVLWTGWLPSDQAWRYARAAEVGLSPIPRGYLLDMSSPTKAIEYMALGLPVVVNDNPDQAQIIKESGAGFCVPLHAQTFAESVVELLEDGAMRERMGASGQQYVFQARAYDSIAKAVADKYRLLCQPGQSVFQPIA